MASSDTYNTARNGGVGGSQPGPTPGSSQNAPLSNKQKYGLNVILDHGNPDYHSLSYSPQVTVDLGVALGDLYSMTPDQIQRLQARLEAGGWLSKGQASPNDLYTAYEQLLVWAAQSGKTPDEALDFSAKTFGAKAAAGTHAPFSPVLASPDDIKSVLEQTVPTILGRKLSDAETNKLVDAYQQIQLKAQQSAYNANISGGATTAAPALDTFAQEQAKQLHPAEAEQYGNLLQARTFMNMIGNFQGSQG